MSTNFQENISNQKSDISETIKKGQSFLGVLYLLMIAVGMLFSYKKYVEYGINIFEYADVFDFFIAPFTDGYIVIFALLTFLVFLALVSLDARLEKKSLKIYTFIYMGLNKKTWFKKFLNIAYIILFSIYMFLASDFYAKFSVNEINSAEQISLTYANGETKVGKQIGKTKEVIFLLVGKEVYAVPITSLVKDIKITTLQENE